ncbi:hypothetical protein Tco_1330203 [Tanacetum coccineum]
MDVRACIIRLKCVKSQTSRQYKRGRDTKVYGKALIKLVKKVKHLEDQPKSTTKRRKAKVVISDEEEDLVSKDPSKQGRISETEYEDVETEHAEEVEFEKTFKSYTRRRSTDSLKVSTAEDLFSTAGEFLSTDEEIAQKLK